MVHVRGRLASSHLIVPGLHNFLKFRVELRAEWPTNKYANECTTDDGYMQQWVTITLWLLLLQVSSSSNFRKLDQNDFKTSLLSLRGEKPWNNVCFSHYRPGRTEEKCPGGVGRPKFFEIESPLIREKGERKYFWFFFLIRVVRTGKAVSKGLQCSQFSTTETTRETFVYMWGAPSSVCHWITRLGKKFEYLCFFVSCRIGIQ